MTDDLLVEWCLETAKFFDFPYLVLGFINPLDLSIQKGDHLGASIAVLLIEKPTF